MGYKYPPSLFLKSFRTLSLSCLLRRKIEFCTETRKHPFRFVSLRQILSLPFIINIFYLCNDNILLIMQIT